MTIEEILSLPYVDAEGLKSLPRVPGLYVALDREAGKVLYVGESVNLRTRWIGHHHLEDLKPWNFSVAWYPEDDARRRRAKELELVHLHDPPLNTLGGRRKPDKLKSVLGAVPVAVQIALQDIAASERRSVSQVIRRLLEESPRLRSQLRKNGKNR